MHAGLMTQEHDRRTTGNLTAIAPLAPLENKSRDIFISTVLIHEVRSGDVPLWGTNRATTGRGAICFVPVGSRSRHCFALSNVALMAG